MPAILTVNGITFNDSTSLNSKYDIIPQSKVSVFFQAAAPTGWTKLITQNDKALRVVSGSGGGSGGTTAFTTAFPNSLKTASATVPVSGTVGGTTLTSLQIPSHNHPGSAVNPQGANHSHTYQRGQQVDGFAEGTTDVPFYSTVNTGPDGAHSHTASIGQSTQGDNSHTHTWGGSGPASVSIDASVQYIDVIICSLD
jgi:hypothetical protein